MVLLDFAALVVGIAVRQQCQAHRAVPERLERLQRMRSEFAMCFTKRFVSTNHLRGQSRILSTNVYQCCLNRLLPHGKGIETISALLFRVMIRSVPSISKSMA